MLCYQGSDLRLRGYSDADWANDPNDRKSTSGFVFMFGGGAISWSNKKHDYVALSTMEAEYISSCATTKEAVWLKRFLQTLGVVISASKPVKLLCDNMATISFAKDPKFHDRTKYVDIKYHFVRTMTERKDVKFSYIPTREMLADPMTKPIIRDLFFTHVRSMGLYRP